MKSSRAQAALPLPVQRALRKLGADLSTARRRRNITIAMVAERAFVGRNTITRVERGDPGERLTMMPRIHSMTLSEVDDQASVETALSVAPAFGLSQVKALKILAEVGPAVSAWRLSDAV